MKLPSRRTVHALFLTRLIGAAAMTLACSVLAPAVCAASLTPDGADLTFGQGHSVFVAGGGVHWDSLCACSDLKAYGFDTRLVAQLTHWHAQVHPTDNGSLWDVGLTP